MIKGKLNSISDKEFIDIVNISDSFRDIKNNIGYTSSSGQVAKKIKDRVLKLNINIDHFTRSKNRNPLNKGNTIHDLKDILIENSMYSNRACLKNRLVKEGYLKYECSICKNTGNWLGDKLSLHIDHINGICNDNRLENLRFLCPNCHSQTDTYSGKNKPQR